jgi:hypothetical protein
MRIAVIVETGEADQGYEEGEEPTFEQHEDDIKELLRSGYYNVERVYPVNEDEDE